MFEVVLPSILAAYFVLLMTSYSLRRLTRQSSDQESI